MSVCSARLKKWKLDTEIHQLEVEIVWECMETRASVYSTRYHYCVISDLPGNKLTLDDFGCVLAELLDVSSLWYFLGVQLKVRVGTLDSIQAQFPDPKRQLLEMLKTWLTTGDNTSWKTLTNALRSRLVEASQLASVLETKYCLVAENEVVAAEGNPAIIVPSHPPLFDQMVPIQQLVDVQESKWKTKI